MSRSFAAAHPLARGHCHLFGLTINWWWAQGFWERTTSRSAKSVVPIFLTVPRPSLKLYRRLIGCSDESADVTVLAGEPGNRK